MNKINPDHGMGWNPNGLEPTQEQTNFDQIVEDAQLFVATNGRQGIPRQVAVDRLIVHTAKQVEAALNIVEHKAPRDSPPYGLNVTGKCLNARNLEWKKAIAEVRASLTHTEEKPE